VLDEEEGRLSHLTIRFATAAAVLILAQHLVSGLFASSLTRPSKIIALIKAQHAHFNAFPSTTHLRL
jgi:hypothetical protein